MPGPMESPRALLDRILRDPPVVHAMDFTVDPPLGLWSTDRDCYELLADSCRPGWRTLETGAGLSTVLLTGLGAHHTCVTPSDDEADRILAYCRSRGIDASRLTFAIGGSDRVLPGLAGDLDLVLIDGSHGFPTPALDWYYAAGRLVHGGLLVLDDIQLPAVSQLRSFLDQDPRWRPERATAKWAAWVRVDQGPLAQDWFDQPWFVLPRSFAQRVAGRVRRGLRRLPRPAGHRGS